MKKFFTLLVLAACAADVLYCHSVICIHQGKQMVNMNQL